MEEFKVGVRKVYDREIRKGLQLGRMEEENTEEREKRVK